MTTDEGFWNFAEPELARDGLEESTMFGFRCVRLNGDFVAMASHPAGGMGVKLPASRVTELISDGTGSPVAPSGRTFREWVNVTDESLWNGLFDEALAFASA